MDGSIFTQLAILAITIMGVLVTKKVLPWLDTKMSAEVQGFIWMVAKYAVKAAEQTFIKPGSGEEKKEFVLQYLKDQGVDIDDVELAAIIEALVYELNLTKHSPPPDSLSLK